MSGDNQSAAEIERDVRGTRAALGRTLDAIDEKLRARRLMQEGLAMVTDTIAEPASAGTGLAGLVRANPISFALIGAGIAWLIAGNTRLLDRLAGDERVQGAVRQITDLAGTIGDGAAAGGAAAAEIAGGWVHTVRDTGSSVIERANLYSAQAGERAGSLWERNALLVGAAGVVAGALLAASLPVPRIDSD